MKTLLRALILALIVLWLGGVMFFPVVAATAFSSLTDTHAAGTIVGKCLRILHYEGLFAGTFLIVLLLAGRRWRSCCRRSESDRFQQAACSFRARRRGSAVGWAGARCSDCTRIRKRGTEMSPSPYGYLRKLYASVLPLALHFSGFLRDRLKIDLFVYRERRSYSPGSCEMVWFA